MAISSRRSVPTSRWACPSPATSAWLAAGASTSSGPTTCWSETSRPSTRPPDPLPAGRRRHLPCFLIGWRAQRGESSYSLTGAVGEDRGIATVVQREGRVPEPALHEHLDVRQPVDRLSRTAMYYGLLM